jgi:hypothetical protein
VSDVCTSRKAQMGAVIQRNRPARHPTAGTLPAESGG